MPAAERTSIKRASAHTLAFRDGSRPRRAGTLQVMKLIDDNRYARGIELLVGIVAMLTKT